MARKRHLLDVLRESENRSTGVTPQPAERPPRTPSSGEGLPPFLIPGVGGAIILALLIWGGCQFFGGGEASPEEVDPISDNPEITVEEGPFGVLAVAYDPSLQDEAVKMGSAVKRLGYDVQLVQVTQDSGSVQLQIFIGKEDDQSALEGLLQEIQAMSLEGQPQPFAGARIAAWPQ
ncbi:MAG: hypothetical protein ACPG31_12670 [Planctomycetota bacterium]